MLPIFSFKNDLYIKFLVLSSCFFSRVCVRTAKEKYVLNTPSYSWFLLQFWPTHHTASKTLHYTGKSKVRRMVQAQHEQSQFTLCKYAVFKFMKIRTAKNRHNVAFFSADCQMQSAHWWTRLPYSLNTLWQKSHRRKQWNIYFIPWFHQALTHNWCIPSTWPSRTWWQWGKPKGRGMVHRASVLRT